MTENRFSNEDLGLVFQMIQATTVSGAQADMVEASMRVKSLEAAALATARDLSEQAQKEAADKAVADYLEAKSKEPQLVAAEELGL